MILINFDTPLSQMTPKEIQFIQLFTKHEMSLISYHEVCVIYTLGPVNHSIPLSCFSRLAVHCCPVECLKNVFVQHIGQCYLTRSEQTINISGILQATLPSLICPYTLPSTHLSQSSARFHQGILMLKAF